jgi:hypothetical protein
MKEVENIALPIDPLEIEGVVHDVLPLPVLVKTCPEVPCVGGKDSIKEVPPDKEGDVM